MFDWDAANLGHIARHKVRQGEAEEALSSYTIELGWQTHEDEDRFVQVGQTAAGRILTVITTWREEKLRVVTAFDASPGFRSFFLASMKAGRHV